MREILFRGKVLKTNKWVYGSCNLENTLASISGCAVIPKTIGQYTGLKDKNGKKVFEGDIIQVELGGKPGSRPCPIYFGEYIDADSDYDDYRCIGFYIKTPDGCGNIGMLLTGEFVCEVIGNIFDNPELLEGKK